MRYNLDYSYIGNHLFEVLLLCIMIFIINDIYVRYFKKTISTDEYDSQLIPKYVKLQRIRKQKR